MEVFLFGTMRASGYGVIKTQNTVQFTGALKTNNATPGPAANPLVVAVPRRAVSSVAQMLLSVLTVAALGREGQGTEISVPEKRR